MRKASLLLPGIKSYTNVWRLDYFQKYFRYRALYSRVYYAGSDVGDQANRMLLFAPYAGTVENSSTPQLERNADKRSKVGVFLFNTHH